MKTNVDAVYAPDRSTRDCVARMPGRLAAGVPSPAPTIDLAQKTVIL